MNGNLVFSQDFNTIDNGHNGTKSPGGNKAGYLYTSGTGQAAANKGLIKGIFPVLDANPNPPNPEYPFDFSILTNNGTTYEISADDSPTMAVNAPNLAQGLAVDSLDNFYLVLVWKYPSGVYYPLARVNWMANFWATGPGPVNAIQDLHGVTAVNPYVVFNSPLAGWYPPVFNGNNQYTPIA